MYTHILKQSEDTHKANVRKCQDMVLLKKIQYFHSKIRINWCFTCTNTRHEITQHKVIWLFIQHKHTLCCQSLILLHINICTLYIAYTHGTIYSISLFTQYLKHYNTLGKLSAKAQRSIQYKI